MTSVRKQNKENNIAQTNCNNQDFSSFVRECLFGSEKEKKKGWICDSIPCSYGQFQVLCRELWSLPLLDPKFLLSFPRCRWVQKIINNSFFGPWQFKRNLQCGLFKIYLSIPSMLVLLTPNWYLCHIFFFAPVTLLEHFLWVLKQLKSLQIIVWL